VRLLASSILLLLAFAGALAPSSAQTPAQTAASAASPYQPADQSWIPKSNGYTQRVLDVQFKYHPEAASEQGLAKYDTKVMDPSFAAQKAQRKEEDAVLKKLIEARGKESDQNIDEDLDIVIKAEQLKFKRDDYALNHTVEYFNATGIVYAGLQPLLDDQVPHSRQISANERMQRYAGIDTDKAGNSAVTDLPSMSKSVSTSSTPVSSGRTTAQFDEIGNDIPSENSLVSKLIARTTEQMKKPGMTYPSQDEVETQLARNADMINGIIELFRKYKLSNWETGMAVLERELVYYDKWIHKYYLPRCREDFRMPPEEYALGLEGYGVDIAPADLATMAHKAFTDYQAQMQTLATEIAKERGFQYSNYRSVIRELKKQQLVGDAILPFYEDRLKDIEKIVLEHNLVSLPDRPAIIRIGTPAESAQQPAPHMVPPPFLHNTGQRGVFVLPLNMPAATGEAGSVKVDDYTFDAASWTLIAHEARPGHELQFDSMVEHGVSLARALFAFNSTNAEGWGLYAEYLTLPYMPKEGQLISLQFRLLRAARAFLDPELQSGMVQPAGAMKILTEDVVMSKPFANEEVERYTFRAPGQANSYFYGFTKLLELRKETEDALGSKFNQQRFHDFILAQGLLPPALMKKAVEEHFIPEEKAR
jgi:uncharacterized protein (DUF885 family)